MDQCDSCRHNKGDDNYFRDVHEYCSEGHCVLCNDEECEDYEKKGREE